LRQVLSNLIGNAIKFTHQGFVQTSMHLSPGDRPGVWLLSFVVQDSGVGFEQDQVEALFQAFQKGDQPTSPFSGTGLGLAITRSLVHLMGGHIEAESRPNLGSTFRFTVRLELAARATETVPAELGPIEHHAGGEPHNILVVDDDLVNRTLAMAMLGKLGLKAEAVSCGEDAVSRVAEGGVDIVLMDMQMPGMDGVQATEFIRGLQLPRQPGIIALTANAFESDKTRCMEAGMDHFLPKPVRMESLREKLSELIALPERTTG
jgi:CheY-like chemotaxis protein